MLAQMKMGSGFSTLSRQPLMALATQVTAHLPVSGTWNSFYDSVTENRATGSHLMQPAGSRFGQTSFFMTAHILTTENLDSENVTPRGLGEDGFWAERNVTNSGEEAFKY